MDFTAFQAQYAPGLNPQQAEAVQTTDGYVLLLAVPGSGKTTVLVTRLAYMILVCGIAPERILTMTYTVAATNDMRSRFASLFGAELASKLQFRTINGVSALVLLYFERRTGRRPFTLVEDDGEQNRIVRDIYRRQHDEYLTDSEVKSFRTAITYVKNQMVGDDELGDVSAPDGFPELYRAYQDTMREQKRMDYDDQMVYALQILRRYPEILFYFQDRFSHICVDEAQDTSKIQHGIIALLAARSGNLFLVGDEDQSIYGFRAAYPQALLGFEREHPGAKVLFMEQNYRSTPEIVAAADAFIQRNADRHEKHMKAVRPHGKGVHEIALRSRSAQYGFLLNAARESGVKTAVLYRDNDSALPLIDLLERSGVPYTARKAETGFFSHRIVRDLREIILLAENPTDQELFLKHYYQFSAPIPKPAAQKAVMKAWREESFFQILAEDETLSAYARRQCKALKAHLEKLPGLSADRAIHSIVHLMGYGEYLEHRGGDLSKTAILEALGRQETSPAGLLRRLDELEQLIGRQSGGGESFVLSTVHSSKGLEYERVFLLDVVDGILPKLGDGTDRDEERRIFYVAMTRAKDELNLFTFKGADEQSEFCREVLAPAPYLRRSCTDAGTLRAGQRVFHKLLGGATVVGSDDRFITLRMDAGETKRFMLDFLREHQMLSLEQDRKRKERK